MRTVLAGTRVSKLVALFMALLVAALLTKFLVPLALYDMPLGYDPGIYRYLFLRYAESLRAFSLPDLGPWAQEYPPGLFVLLSPLVVAGMPVDMLIGWIWNLFAVILACTLASVSARRWGAWTGVTVLLVALLSQPYFDGFYAMYWKTFASLFFVVLTYHFAERMSWWFPATAFAAVLIHQQTGLILILALGVWWILQIRLRWREKTFRTMTLTLGLLGLLAALWYVPHWERAVWSPLKSILLLRGDNAPAGSFPETTFYLKSAAIVLLLGVIGYLRSFTKERGSLWQISVGICLAFIVLRLVFYRRFFLQLDFFLMPFAASAIIWLWMHSRNVAHRGLLVLVLLAQCIVSVQVMRLRMPLFRKTDLARIEQVAAAIPEGASVIALENVSGTWLRGWLPAHRVGAPGLFDYPGWTYDEWELFIDGTNGDRRALLGTLEHPSYFFLTTFFTGYYGDRANGVLRDPCLRPVADAPLLESVCDSR